MGQFNDTVADYAVKDAGVPLMGLFSIPNSVKEYHSARRSDSPGMQDAMATERDFTSSTTARPPSHAPKPYRAKTQVDWRRCNVLMR